VARLLARRGQGHAARQGDLRTAILAARGAAAASGMNATRIRMSALGQKAKYSLRAHILRFALKAESSRTLLEVRSVPFPDFGAILNDFPLSAVGTG
jgi:hypothetical protein